jgi:thymidylate synthase
MEHNAEKYAKGLREIIIKEEETYDQLKICVDCNENSDSDNKDGGQDGGQHGGQNLSDLFSSIGDLPQETRKNPSHEEYQYLDLLKDILDNGTWEDGRNGRTTSVFGRSMRFSRKDGKIPILTTKKTAWKTCLKELLWFIRGETDNMLLKEQGVHIWDANASRDFLDSRGLKLYREDLIGPGYGYQWRYFNAAYNCITGKRILDADAPGEENIYAESIRLKGIDQLQQIIDALKDPSQRTTRRLVMTAWNPAQLDQMALPPCHILCQFNVHDGNKLSCSMYQRSNDEACGSCFNIASYSFLTHLLAKHCNLEAYEFVYFKGNCHIYEDHVEGIKTQLLREPHPFPTVLIKQIRENINDYEVSDFELFNYQHHPQIKFQMVA